MRLPSAFFAALAALTLAALPAARAQFTDTFNTISPAWVVDRYAPAGFSSVLFDGSNRLQLTLNQTGSSTNRPSNFSGSFYNTQGYQRPGGITGLWTLNADLYVPSSFNDASGQQVSSDIWAHTGTTPGGGDYAIFGFTDEPLPTRAFRFLAWTSSTGYVAINVSNGFQFDAWHNLSITSTGATFEFRVDGVTLLTAATSAGNDLLSAMVQGYNFGGAGSYSTSVYWDNLTASAIPEPAVTAFAAAIGALGVVAWRRRRPAI